MPDLAALHQALAGGPGRSRPDRGIDRDRGHRPPGDARRGGVLDHPHPRINDLLASLSRRAGLSRSIRPHQAGTVSRTP